MRYLEIQFINIYMYIYIYCKGLFFGKIFSAHTFTTILVMHNRTMQNKIMLTLTFSGWIKLAK